MVRRGLDLLNASLLVAIVGFAAWAWPRLPAEIPVHFGFDGRADRWEPRTVMAWFAIPAIAVIVHLGLLWMRSLTTARPEWLNLPGGTRLDDHPPSVRAAILEHIRAFLAVVMLELLVIFGLIQVGSYATAMGGDGQSAIVAVLAVALLSGPVLLVLFFIGFQRASRSPDP